MKLFLCAGAAKAGTSWLYEMFKDNQQLSFPQMKEIDYLSSTYGGHAMPSRNLIGDREKRLKVVELGLGAFDSDEMKDHYLNGDLDDDWYINMFSYRAPCLADFSPSTALLPISGWEHIVNNICNDVRVMYIIRNPYDLLWSRIRFFYRVRDPVEVPETEDEYRKFIDDNDLLVSSLIGNHYARMRAVIPSNELKVFFYEDLRDNPHDFVRSVERFVGLKQSKYEVDKLNGWINVSPVMKRPEFLNGMYRDYFEHELNILQQYGIRVPMEWRLK